MHSAHLALGSVVLVACTALSSPSLEPEPTGGSGGAGQTGTAGTGGASATAGSGGSGDAGTSATAGNGGAAGAGGVPVFPWQPSARSGIPSPPYFDVPPPSGPAGNLRVLDWAGFTGALSYTFDDGNQSQIALYDDLNALGVRFTFYLVSSWAGAQSPIWARALADGHEIGNHTASHLGEGSTLAEDTDTGEAFIENALGTVVYTMAAPFGADPYVEIAKARYLLNRGASDGLIAPNGTTDPFNLNCFLPPADASSALLDAKVNAARAGGAWQIVLIHGFSEHSDGAYQPVSFETFTGTVQHAKQLGDMWLDSVVNIGAYWVAQRLFAGLTPESAGDTATWTWTLPEHFPSGKYLRVVVDGGTLSQGGAPLEWDPHGYYEVALDLGSLTLSL